MGNKDKLLDQKAARKAYELKELAEGRDWDVCLVFNDAHHPDDPILKDIKWKKSSDRDAAVARYAEQRKIMNSIRQAGLIVSEPGIIETAKPEEDDKYIKITAKAPRLEEEADRIDYNCQLRPEKYGGYAPFHVAQRDLFRGDGSEEFTFRKVDRIRLILSILEAGKADHGAGLDLNQLTRGTQVVTSYFGLHDSKNLDILEASWAGRWFRPQPLDRVRDYFGEKIALYFAWLGFYTKWLIAPSLCGLILFVFSFLEWGLNNPFVPAFCVIMALWATLFLEFWKREQITLAVKWGVTDFEESEPVRPEYYGDQVYNEITHKPEIVYSRNKKYVKLGFSLATILFMVMVVLVAVVGIFIFRILYKNTSWGPLAAGMINAVQIQILNMVYGKVALALNKFENHRTETEYEDNLIGKIFMFQFVNSYNALFYIAFFKAHASLLGHSDECKGGDCLSELFVQCACLLGTKIFVGNMTEVGIPYVKRQLKLRKDRAQEKAAGGDGILDAVEEQLALAPYTSTFDDYAEMIIQFGYVTLFVTAFPLAPLLALCNNMIEIRADAYKLCNEHRRPIPWQAEDIGTWYYILEIMSTLAVITNCAIFAFTTTALAGYPAVVKLTVFVGAEHFILIIKYFIAFAVPDEPTSTRKEREKMEYGVQKFIHGITDDNEFGMGDDVYSDSEDEEAQAPKKGAKASKDAKDSKKSSSKKDKK